MNIRWDAEGYRDRFSFVSSYGEGLLELIDLRKDMRVVDLGCGNGRLTKELARCGARVLGIDSSESQIEIARQTYPDLSFELADAASFEAPEPQEVVFSNAMLHWVDRGRQPAVLGCVQETLVEGGQFVFEMGGAGNNRTIHDALRRVFEERGYSYHMPFFFPTIGEYAPLLEQAGLLVTSLTLFDRPTRLAGENGMADWIGMFVKEPFDRCGIASAERDEMVAEASVRLRAELFCGGAWFADYVRLRGKCVKDAAR